MISSAELHDLAAAVAQLSFTPSPAESMLEESRDSIIAAISAAQKGKPATDYLPVKMLDHFRLFGRSLRDDEAFELSAGPYTATLTKETRHRLVEAALSDAIEIRDISLVGTIPEADQDKSTFTLLLEDGQKLIIPGFGRHRETVLEAFNKYDAGARVRLRGSGLYRESDKLESIESLDFLRILETLDVAERIEELKKLGDGWLDGEGKRPPPDGLAWFALAFDNNFSERLLLPYLYPTIQGGLRAEWTIGDYEASLEINVNERNAEWHELNLHTDADSSRTLDLRKTVDWDWIVRRLEEIGGQRSD